MERSKPPSSCHSKEDIRGEIDRLDLVILKLFAERQGYVRRMAELKQHPSEAFDPERIETMLSALRTRAAELGFEPEQTDRIWRAVIDWNVAYEERTIAARLGGGS
ncbi:hypothetical protein GCM10011316_24940 [Roseibium aquae]|uniref:chorismate mutase n=1 Tax=Roseibium aquae TaxID=1323746 RepID=A0A916TKH6_9HYPH|nr:chorismate mutase [Roseibium aquae]GGB51955.1 hypothetical protein GCM10011316_24940 [Roseibium aquae]